MFNQRPTSLELPRQNAASEFMNFLSPISPGCEKFLDFLIGRESYSKSLNTPPAMLVSQNPTLTQYHQIQHQQHLDQQNLLHQQQQQQPLIQLQQQQQQHLDQQNQLHQLQQQQQQQQPLIHLQQPPPPPQQQQHSQPSEQQIKQESCPPSVQVEQQPRARLSDEEKLRNKRERNRRAAANCRRRKDERLKKYEDENKELKLTIERLEAQIAALQQYPTMRSLLS